MLLEINACRTAHPDRYVRVNAYDARLGRQTVALSFLVQRPVEEPGFRLERQETADRRIAYTNYSYATGRPAGDRYQPG
ncbi:ribulose bisphosphate carboxylase small subunit [Fodinicola feengrottensis]|uniref:ribulose bisphosphate carboxylase small subunit n=1 Tax=Fodinicola feengrottensis TaxID=435914 RepID=UPI002441301B|nr:ribulose bisphosphate carboxylase small subunit [Fodinicola feengrottensis]